MVGVLRIAPQPPYLKGVKYEEMGDNFSKFMNPPEEWDGQALKKSFPDGTLWMVCPFCYKKAVKILPETKISKMPYKCGGSNCKKEFEINV